VASFAIRTATPDDLPQTYDIWYAAEIEGDPLPPPPRPVASWLSHVLEHGRLLVYDGASGLVGFASIVEREGIVYLCDLFVRRAEQSHRLGGALLRAVLPTDARVLCTCASTDIRALALYTRAGMRPRWPHLWLCGHSNALGALDAHGVRTVEADPADPALLDWDAEIGGRQRPDDHAYWVQHTSAVPLWFCREARTIGYGYAQQRSDESLWYPDATTLGPLGARTPGDAADCVLAAVAWARERTRVVRLALPGLHPALAPLLDAHLEITYVETFCSSADEPFFDPRLYVGSGAVL
jgi:GNAT superfamily N-acetyltransferase